MNNSTARATPRDILSPRYGASHSLARNGNLPIAAMIPTLELRRLVATMVD
ncbi:hypothetical protein [Qipengyuania qiaonensis]|uniref:Uncharacterized protein n=1 Tax=Qipengyuania qiaonensis TaxID=2867240 RepID=A0ABS7JD96_9SPHN|nr:hypothetical protein [Qipengyuania qiaonensis]MBX7482952.1 hypothetical protein [Qipengyuania qiaonensis]